MSKEKLNIKNLSGNLKQLYEITNWFEKQEEVDIEEGLEKVKDAVVLIKASKERLKAIENEFEEIKKEVDIKDVDNDKENNNEYSSKENNNIAI